VDDKGRREGGLVEPMVELDKEVSSKILVYGPNISDVRRKKSRQRWFEKKSQGRINIVEKMCQIPRER
jgi:hypothetical protein